MKRKKFPRLLFVSLAGLLSLPWLMPCTFGIGTMASSAINLAARPLATDPLDYLPHPDLKQWAARPGPLLDVQAEKTIPRTLFIRDDELTKNAAKAPRPSLSMRGKAGNIVGFVSKLLAITDASSRELLDGSLADDIPGSTEDQRRQLALNEFPFVLLQGDELPYRKQNQQPWPQVARASNRSKVTVITADGTFFGIAQRIHFRSDSSEVILEGDPTVQSGQQHIKGTKPDTFIKLDFAKRRVIVSGPVVEKKLFR